MFDALLLPGLGAWEATPSSFLWVAAMTITLAFWVDYGITTEPGQRANVERQAHEWAEAEPRITACRIVKAERSDSEPPNRWHVTVDVDFDSAHPDNMTLWGAA
jgi:hypothetical protein